MHFGEWDGQTWSEIEQKDATRFRRWMDDWVTVAPPSGESATDLAARAAAWLTETLAASDSAECIIVVSHAGWIRAALMHLLRRDLARMFDIAVEHARATIVDCRIRDASFSPRICRPLEPGDS